MMKEICMEYNSFISFNVDNLFNTLWVKRACAISNFGTTDTKSSWKSKNFMIESDIDILIV